MCIVHFQVVGRHGKFGLKRGFGWRKFIHCQAQAFLSLACAKTCNFSPNGCIQHVNFEPCGHFDDNSPRWDQTRSKSAGEDRSEGLFQIALVCSESGLADWLGWDCSRRGGRLAPGAPLNFYDLLLLSLLLLLGWRLAVVAGPHLGRRICSSSAHLDLTLWYWKSCVHAAKVGTYAGTTGAGGGYFIFVLDLVVLVSGRALLISDSALLVSDGALLISGGVLMVSDGAPPDSGLISAGIVCTGHLHQPPPPLAIKHSQIFHPVLLYCVMCIPAKGFWPPHLHLEDLPSIYLKTTHHSFAVPSFNFPQLNDDKPFSWVCRFPKSQIY